MRENPQARLRDSSTHLLRDGVHVRGELPQGRIPVLRHHAAAVEVLQRLVRVHLHRSTSGVFILGLQVPWRQGLIIQVVNTPDTAIFGSRVLPAVNRPIV